MSCDKEGVGGSKRKAAAAVGGGIQKQKWCVVSLLVLF
jgi:hypothetical protein